MKNKKEVLIVVLVIALIALAVKLIFFRVNTDDYFARNDRSLKQVPAGLVILRPTHFPFLKHEDVLHARPSHAGVDDWRMMGRNLPLCDVIAAAYGVEISRVVLPPGAPKNRFDFLVTVPTKQKERLQAALRQKLGYVAQKETRDTDVLALKIVDANPSGLTISGSDEKENAKFNDIKITFQDLPLLLIAVDGHAMRVADGLEQFLATPVMDKTGLTNRYDYSLTWDVQTRKDLRDPETARPVVDKILGGWGLGLKPDTASLEMLVVKKTE